MDPSMSGAWVSGMASAGLQRMQQLTYQGCIHKCFLTAEVLQAGCCQES